MRTLLLALTAALAACASSGDRTLRVLTYNIHHGRGADGEIDLPRIAAVIRGATPDLVALQEVDRETGRSNGVDQAGVLGEQTGLEAVFGAAMPYDGGEYGEAVLTRLPIEARRVHALSASPGHEPRAAVELVVRAPWGELVSFTGTHLDHTRDSTDRETQSRELVAALAGDVPAVLVGDLNAEPDAKSLDVLSPAWTRVESGATFPSDAPNKAIDHVLFRPADGWEVVSVEVLDAPEASDHAPLLVVLRRR